MIIAITGSIGSGKTVVSSILRTRGYRVISSDKIANELLGSDISIKNAVTGHFGNNILDESGDIDRGKLAAIVFNDKDKLAELNKIMHPPVVDQLMKAYENEKRDLPFGLLFIELPLYIESRFYERADRSILITAPLDKKLKYIEQKGLFAADTVKRLENQASDDEYRKYTDYEIVNDADKASVEAQLDSILKLIIDAMPLSHKVDPRDGEIS